MVNFSFENLIWYSYYQIVLSVISYNGYMYVKLCFCKEKQICTFFSITIFVCVETKKN